MCGVGPSWDAHGRRLRSERKKSPSKQVLGASQVRKLRSPQHAIYRIQVRAFAICKLCFTISRSLSIVFRFIRCKRRTGIKKSSPFEWLDSRFETEQLLILNWLSFRIAQIRKPPDMFDMELTGTKRQKQIIRLFYQFTLRKIFLKAAQKSKTVWAGHFLVAFAKGHASNRTLPGT